MSRTTFVSGLLAAAWATIVGWQAIEHHRVETAARSAVISRARDITATLGIVIRSQRRFGGIVSQPRLESALKELVKSDDLKSVVLLNAAGAVVASAGQPLDVGTKGMPPSGVHWQEDTVTVVNLVDLGTTSAADGERSQPTIVLPDPGPEGRARGDRGRFPAPASEEPREGSPEARPRGERPRFPSPPPPWLSRTNATNTAELAAAPTNRGDRADPRPSPPTEGRPRFRRPPWMTEAEFRSLIEKQGLHGLMIAVSTDAFRAASVRDLWLRYVIVGFAGVAAIGCGLAWRSLVRSSEFQMRLLRASEMNAHLREMNVAAAGLAHETRNPLNIIRGVAQMISKEAGASPEIQTKSLEIADEVDRVTAQLNEFINYSKPREVRRAPVALHAVVGDVVRALATDLEDKRIRLTLPNENLIVDADEQLLRQVLFNLLINAVQAVGAGGAIQIEIGKAGPQGAFFQVRDDGPGVPAEHRTEVFRPYFTTNQTGTGLGLAVVNQIVLAHGWEVECRPNLPRGAIFRVSRVQLAAKA
jgi:signal transduction histidine kinase